MSDIVIKISGEKRPSYESPLGSSGANPTLGGPPPVGPTPGGPTPGGPPPGNCACAYASVLYYNHWSFTITTELC